MYQVAPQGQNELTVPLAIELFTRFFSRLLEKEIKFPTYLQEWNSFKNILTQEPFNIDNAFLQLAKVQINLERGSNNSISIPDVSPSMGNNFLKALDDYKVNIDKSITAESPDASKYQRTPRGFLTAPPDYHGSSSKRTSIQIFNDDLSKIMENNSSLNNFLTPSYTSTPFDNSDINLIKTKSGEVQEYHKSTTDLFTLMLDPSSAPKKHDLSFVTSKARTFKENFALHSDNVIQNSQKKKNTPFNMEERTPLRKFVVYAKDQQNNGNGQKALQTAAEQFNLKIQNDPKNIAYNHITLFSN